jgi:hypothetical protein
MRLLIHPKHAFCVGALLWCRILSAGTAEQSRYFRAAFARSGLSTVRAISVRPFFDPRI